MFSETAMGGDNRLKPGFVGGRQNLCGVFEMMSADPFERMVDQQKRRGAFPRTGRDGGVTTAVHGEAPSLGVRGLFPDNPRAAVR